MNFYPGGVWYVLISDGVALLLIFFADDIDDLTFGQWMQGGIPAKIDAHTPPFLIALFGWAILLFNTFVLFFSDWIRPAAHN